MNLEPDELQQMLKRNPELRLEESAISKARDIVLGKKRHKYNAERTEYNGQWYQSGKEAQYAELLDHQLTSGGILWWCRHPKFVLPGGVVYEADFIYAEDGEGHLILQIHIVDVKGFKTKEYRLKKKQVESIYHIKIEEV